MSGRDTVPATERAGRLKLLAPVLKEDFQAAVFGAKCAIAALLAYYVALRIGLSRPVWAVFTSFLVAQPLAGAVLSKAVFRLGGTLLGAAATIILVPNLVNAPIVLSLALAVWLGLCVFIAQHDRTPRSYVFLLAGYTASIIGFPSVEVPQAVFDTAVVRVQEIGIGIISASLIHGLLVPVSVSSRLLARVGQILRDAERWSAEALGPETVARSRQSRRRLAMDISELHQLAVHIPFDVSRVLPRMGALRNLQHELTMVLPLGEALEDRLAELRELNGLTPVDDHLVGRARAFLLRDYCDRGAVAAYNDVTARLGEVVRSEEGGSDWRSLLRMNLFVRLGELVSLHRDCRLLEALLLDDTEARKDRRAAELAERSARPQVHVDRGLAARTAAGSVLTVLLGTGFWIATAWPDGAGAILISSVSCALFGGFDRPAAVIRTFLTGVLAGIVLAAVYGFAILPRVTDFVTLGAVYVPLFVACGSMLARPKNAGSALGILTGFTNTVGLNATYSGNFPNFANSALALALGILFSLVAVGFFHTVGLETRLRRLLRSVRRAAARQASSGSTDRGAWIALMVDRIGQMVPRALGAGPAGGRLLESALGALRAGYLAGELRTFAVQAEGVGRESILAVLRDVGNIYAGPEPKGMPAEGQANMDRAIIAVRDGERGHRRRQGLVLLTSLRRNLYPSAPHFEG